MMKVGDTTHTTKGRYVLNTYLVPRMAQLLDDGCEVLFVGTDTSWDYKPFFWSPAKQCPYFTLDKNPAYNPDIVGDIQNCPDIPDDKFSLVMLIGVFEFLDHKPEAFAEIKRILCKDGYLLVALPGKGYFNDARGVERKEVLDICKDFQILETYYVYEAHEEPNSIIVICQKK